MAANIFHGAPGSFKSASAVWCELLPALRAGRIVVTNIEGLLTKESIEIELEEKFPESADIWRLSSQTEHGLYCWRRWFWWMPVKAFIILDEVQDVYPADAKVIKPEEFDYQGIEPIKHMLPEKFYDYSVKARKEFTPDIDEGSQDDTGTSVLDENGLVLYPKNMREANMRHRKYGWDIIYCTPVIAEVHKLVRSVCEFAYYHKYNQALEIIPYFVRRPRIHEHHPTSTGLPKKKDDPTKWRFIPVDVHKCYRSTSTGVVTKRAGVNAFKSPVFLINAALLLGSLCYFIWFFFGKESASEAQSIPISEIQKYAKEDIQSAGKTVIVPSSVDSDKTSSKSNVPLVLPYNSQQVYFNGHQTITLNKDKKYREYFFTFIIDNKKLSMSSDRLLSFGLRVKYVNDCAVKIYNSSSETMVYCEPVFNNESPIQERDQQEPIQV
jgi:zona occludens toxin